MTLRVPVALLACPACRGAVAERGACLVCEPCGEAYAISGGIPILMASADRERFSVRLDDSAGSEMAGRYAERASGSAAARIKRALRPPLPLVHNPSEPRLPCPPGSNNLWIGGGGQTIPGFCNLDIGLFPGVDLVANAEHLPLRDGVLDAIECDAVLEHVDHPEWVVCEALRVLKPGGLFHAVVPFCHPYHAYPADHRRWTGPGLDAWLSGLGFEIVQSGVRTGPTATLLTFMLEYNKVLLGTGPAGKAARAAAGWLLFPLRYLDVWLNRKPEARLLANHVFALARKPCNHG